MLLLGGHSLSPLHTAWQAECWLDTVPQAPSATHFCAVNNLHNLTGRFYVGDGCPLFDLCPSLLSTPSP